MVALKTGRKNKDVLLCGSRTNYEQVSTVIRETGRERGVILFLFSVVASNLAKYGEI